ncbi:E3 ubiquitin-protein ligase DCST1 isoform X1 [Xiphophorus couchianus]|uniref:E3 ubiquitin-protein ligase DCST1 isoform X1 n=1 Tax=Xiphophorus couchianus TaxID=32473 RepID=UPI00101713FD|nr:E3 ubiquitin-protein ligase DCST1 isoform X1 [Xiphophorus couchianus]
MCGAPPVGWRAARLPQGSRAALVGRGLFGAAGGSVLYLGFAHNLPLTFDLKLAVGFAFVGVCIVGGFLSSSFRCTILLTLPSILGSRGRSYLMVMIVMILYRGPISNTERNAEVAAMSLSCNLDLQVQHSKVLWRLAARPFLLVAKQLMKDKVEFESESLDINKKFQNVRDEVLLQYGYDPIQPGGAARGNSTQEHFASNTRRRCDGVVDEGIRRCAGWFRQKWSECMKAIPVPIINHILCISMKFDFLCDVMRTMTPWCREQIPVERNFGQLYDRLNVSMDRLSREFRARVVVQQEEQQQSVLDGVQLDRVFTESVKESFQRLTKRMEQGMKVLEMVLSFTFITVFIQAVQYLRSYRTNISFDNVYITSYFRRIDERRRRAGKHFLLPLRKSERKRFIAPMSPKINSEELIQVASGGFQVLAISLLAVVLLVIDFSLFHVLDIISRHTFTQFNITSSHHIDISVGGDTMMARLLRTTISGFNSSSETNVQSDNRACMSAPSRLPFEVYARCVGGVLVVALFSCVQVYTNRLRHVIAAFYNPKREKKRVLFLYNLQLHRRLSSPNWKMNMSQRQRMRTGTRTMFQRLTRWGRRLLRHPRQDASDQEETHYASS